MPDGEGIPLLIQLARATRDNEVRKQAMNSLGNPATAAPSRSSKKSSRSRGQLPTLLYGRGSGF